MENKKTPYRQYNCRVSRQFRDTVFGIYPQLKDNEFYRRMTQHLLLSGRTEDVPGHGVVTSQEVVYSLARTRSHQRSAESWIREYAEALDIKLVMSDVDHDEHKARVVTAEFDPRVLVALERELCTSSDQKVDPCFFVTGEPVSRRRLKAEQREEERYLIELSKQIDKNHPAKELMDYLREEQHHEKHLRKILPALRAAADEKYTGKRLEHNLKIIAQLEQYIKVYYHTTKKSSRIFASKLNVLGLSRELRKLAFSECHTFDLACAHLAIDAKLWGLPRVSDFLAARNKPWKELAGYAQVDVGTYSSTFKASMYGLSYGMSQTTIYETLAYGDPKKYDIIGMGEAAAEHLVTHWLFHDLLKGRGQQEKIIIANRGAYNAFGRWIELTWKARDGKPMPNTGSVLSQIAQSYELQIMLQILPILKDNPQIHVMGWLHDGVTLKLSNTSKVERWEKQIVTAVDAYCQHHGYNTYLEVERPCAMDERQLAA